MDLEIIHISEASQSRPMSYVIDMWDLKYDTNE